MNKLTSIRNGIGSVMAIVAVITSGTLVAVDCNKTFDNPGVCHLHTGFNYGYSICEEEILEGPGWNEDYVPKAGTAFIVDSTYTVPYTARHWKYDKDDVEEICLTTGFLFSTATGECNEYSYNPNCDQPPT